MDSIWFSLEPVQICTGSDTNRFRRELLVKSTIGSPARAGDFLKREAETKELWFRASETLTRDAAAD